MLYVTLLALANKYGVKDKDKIKDSNANIGIKLENKSTNDILHTIPNQNIRFQKLSILQFFINIFNDYKKLLVVLAVAFSSSVVNAEDLKLLISQAEKDFNIPKGLLASVASVASVESGLKPYALNIAGKAVEVTSEGEALKVIKASIKEGIRNIDIGVMQVNYRWHGKEFKDIEEMLTPSKNIEYAAKHLKDLYEIHKSWPQAVRHYHSAQPKYHNKYSRKIILTWLNS